MGILLAALVVAGIWAWRSWPHKLSPFDNLPPEVGKRSALTNDVKAPTSGRLYKVTSFAPNAADDTYHVAELKSAPNYVRYWQNRGTGARRFHSAYVGSSNDPGAQAQIVQQMKGDFGVP